jgi:hypothetical protein
MLETRRVERPRPRLGLADLTRNGQSDARPMRRVLWAKPTPSLLVLADQLSELGDRQSRHT